MNLRRIKRGGGYDFKGRKKRVKTSGNVSNPIVVCTWGSQDVFHQEKNHKRNSTEEDGDTVMMAWWGFWVSSWWRSSSREVGARTWSHTAHGWCGEETFSQGSQDSVCKGVDHAPPCSRSLPNWSHWAMWGLLPLVSLFHEHKSC